MLVSSLVAVASAAPMARAGFMGEGYTVTLDYPAIGTTYQGPFTGTVGAGTEIASLFGTSQDIGDDTILITEKPGNQSVYTLSAFSGYHYTFTGAPVITGASLDPSSTGFAPIVTFDADEIFVNYGGAFVNPGDFSLIDVTFAPAQVGPGGGSSVPVPAAIYPGLLLGGGMVANRLRRDRRAA